MEFVDIELIYMIQLEIVKISACMNRGVLVSITKTMDTAMNICIAQQHVISQGENSICSTKVITLLVILSNFCLTFQTTHLLEKMLEGTSFELITYKVEKHAEFNILTVTYRYMQ